MVLAVAVASGSVLGACAGDAEVGGPALGGSLAAKVDGFEYTNSELEEEVEQWASNPEFLAQAVGISDLGSPGRRSAELVTFVLSHRILTEQSRELARDQDFAPGDAEVSALVGQLDQAFQGAGGQPLFQGYGDAFRQQLGTDFAYQQNLQTVDPETAEVPDVDVNPRYGSFEDQDRGLGRVVPPPGPLPDPSGR
jgi:hypothetical protein